MCERSQRAYVAQSGVVMFQIQGLQLGITYSRLFLGLFGCLYCLFVIACAKKEVAPKQDLKTQIHTQQPSIPFATTQAQSNKWYKEHFSPILKKSTNKKDAQDYEQFAKVYFADLSQIQHDNAHIPQDKLLQSVSFTHFGQAMLEEFLFIQEKGLIIAPWEAFQSEIHLYNGILSASFVARLSGAIEQMENESYENLNAIVLASSLLQITQKYTNESPTNTKTKDITGMANYVLPDSLYSYLFYKILYAKYSEKFQSNFILHTLAQQFPDQTLKASNALLHTKHNNIKAMRQHFAFTNFEPTNPTAIAQCKAGNTQYPKQQNCIQQTFIAWLAYLQSTLRQHNSLYVLPIFTDSKLCALIGKDSLIAYPHNNGRFCQNLIASWQNYSNARTKRESKR